MENHIGKVCPFCKTEIKEGEAIIECPACGIAHHASCWEENKGCTTFGCSQQHYEEQGTNPTEVCANCGAVLGDGQAFCPSCGTPKAAPSNKCSNCGTELKDGQGFCPNCGQKAGLVEESVNVAINQFNANVTQTQQTKEKNKFTLIGIGAIAAVVLIVVLIVVLVAGGNSGPDFEAVYDEYCDSPWAEVGSDGSYLYIDTNPYDEEDSGIAYWEAYEALEEVNKALGLPDSLFEEMGQTSGIDGRQSEEYEDLGIEVTWKYHPDSGLEATYKKK